MDSGDAWKALWRVLGVRGGSDSMPSITGKQAFQLMSEAEMETADLPVSLAAVSSQAGFKAKLVDLSSRGYQD